MTPDQRAAQKASTEAQARVKRENAAHTPGPWQLLPEEAGKDYLRIRGTQLGGRYKVANVHCVVCEGMPEISRREATESLANARLIAAAPELLDALKACAGVCAGEVTTKSGLINALEKARAVMRKATGDTP